MTHVSSSGIASASGSRFASWLAPIPPVKNTRIDSAISHGTEDIVHSVASTTQGSGVFPVDHRPRPVNLATIRAAIIAAIKDAGYLHIREGRRDHSTPLKLSASTASIRTDADIHGSRRSLALPRQFPVGSPIPWLPDGRRDDSQFDHNGSKVTPVKVVVMAGSGEFRCEGPERTNRRYAVRAPSSPLVVIQPTTVAE